MLYHKEKVDGNYFIILFTPRTGSHLCRSTLVTHPDVVDISKETITNQILEAGDCNELWIPVHGLHGHKISANTLNLHKLFDVLIESLPLDCKIIITYRNNKLSQFISRVLATRDNCWGESVRYKDEKIDVSINEAIWSIAKWQKIENDMRVAFPDALWVEYGELVDTSGFKKIQKFLQLPTIELEKQLKRQSKGVNFDYVKNRDDVMNSELAGWI